MKDPVEDYLKRFATTVNPGCHVTGMPDRSFNHVVVVPCHDEGDTVRHMVQSVPGGDRSLVVLVVNDRARDGASVHERNRQTIRWVKQWESAPASDRARVLCVARTVDTEPLGPRQGVGMARRLGCDLALRGMVEGRLGARWLHCTDADARLPRDYFARAVGHGGAALTYPFTHGLEGPGWNRRAVMLYETFLRHYVAGLAYAESPYAFFTVGSTMALCPEAYARVRGIPDVLAAEDFHLLNKLAKVGAIHNVPGEPIALSGRASARVPFGTGPTVRRWGKALSQGQGVPFYHPKCFWVLRLVLRYGLRVVRGERDLAKVAPMVRRWFEPESETMGHWHDACRGALRCSTQAVVRERFFHHRFDALRTRQAVFELRKRWADVMIHASDKPRCTTVGCS